MTEQRTVAAGTRTDVPGAQTLVVNVQAGGGRSWFTRLVMAALVFSVVANFGMFAAYQDYFSIETSPHEKYRSGDRFAQQKIAVIDVDSTIMPPYTDRIIRAIRRAKSDDAVKGVVLRVDSPGGLVADSHEIYHELGKLAGSGKPITVSMRRLAASGGYYVSMGAGPKAKIWAEPTTWTGSIGVIIPRYDLSQLAGKVGISSEPLKTGEFKDALNPFRELTEAERALWTNIMNESFDMFVQVIDENRDKLDREGVRKLATGQIYTAKQAKENGLVDEIGFLEDAVEDLQKQLGLEQVRVVKYESPPTLLDLLSESASSDTPERQWQALLDLAVPRAMFLCTGMPVPVAR